MTNDEVTQVEMQYPAGTDEQLEMLLADFGKFTERWADLPDLVKGAVQMRGGGRFISESGYFIRAVEGLHDELTGE